MARSHASRLTSHRSARFIVPLVERRDGILTIRLPLKTVGEQNQREHWSKRNQRRGAQQMLLLCTVGAPQSGAPSLPVQATFTRISPRPLDDDNRVGSFKGPRDALAVWLGLPTRKLKPTDKRKRLVANDSDPRVRWRYAEEERNEGVRLYGVEVRIEPLPVLGTGKEGR